MFVVKTRNSLVLHFQGATKFRNLIRRSVKGSFQLYALQYISNDRNKLLWIWRGVAMVYARYQPNTCLNEPFRTADHLAEDRAQGI
jgi:hypothetical protein